MKKILIIMALLIFPLYANASDGGAQWRTFGPFINSSGTVELGIKVDVYTVGTTTNKTYWTDEAKTTPGAHPLVDADSDGVVGAYFDGDYRFRVKDSDGTALTPAAIDWDNVKVTSDTGTMWEGNCGTSFPSATAANRWQLACKHTAGNQFRDIAINDGTQFVSLFGIGTFSASNYADCNAAIADIGVTKATLVVREDCAISATVSAPSTLTWRIEGGGSISPASGTVLTINGAFKSGESRTIICVGTETCVKFAGGGHVPEISTAWWYDGSDFGIGFNAAFGSIPTGVADFGAVVTTPPGVYTATTEPFIPATSVPLEYRAYGVVLKSSGAISGLKIGGGSVAGPRVVRGLKISHRGNSTALFGINIEGGWNVRLKDILIEAHGVSATYAGVRVANTVASDPNTGSFWTRIENLWVRKQSGGDPGDVTIGVLLEGNANATTIMGGGMNTCVTCILIRNQSGETSIPNAVVIDSVAFENYTTAIHMTGATGSNIAGLRVVNNRFENGTTVFSLTTVTTIPSVVPFFMGNYMVSNAGTYVNNPIGHPLTLLDFHTTPNIGAPIFSRGVIFKGQNGADQPIIAVPAGGGRGIHLREATGVTDVLALTWTGTANGANMYANTGGVANLNMRGVKGINGGGTSIDSKNLRGSCTFAAAATCVRTIATEVDNAYFIALGGRSPETFYVSSKSTTQFVITSSNVSSVAVVDWIMIR